MIYYDNAATTQLNPILKPTIDKYLMDSFYNPSAMYQQALSVKKELEQARKDIAELLRISAQELYFVSSGSEANNTVLRGVKLNQNQEILVSAAEHPSVYNTAKYLSGTGKTVKFLPVDRFGRVQIKTLCEALNANTGLVSIMHVSNETGAINDIEGLLKATKQFNKNIVFHSDGVQAFGKINTNLTRLGIDSYTISAHKIGGMKGVGALYVKRGIQIKPLILGGAQEQGFRASTENVAGIISFAMASIDAKAKMEQLVEKSNSIFRIICDKLQELDGILINRDVNFAPSILSVSIKGIKSEVLLRCLNARGVIVGTGSACSSQKRSSRITDALKIPNEYKEGMLRISICNQNTVDEAVQAAQILVDEIKKLRGFLN